MRPAREILRDLAACFQFPTQDARLAALVEEAREFERVADGMTSPPPEGCEFTLSVRPDGLDRVRLQVHGADLRLSNDEATIIGRELTRLGGRSR